MAVGATAPAIAKGRPCRKCGADEWRMQGGRIRCAPCSRRLCRDSKRRQAQREPALRLLHSARERAGKAGIEFGLTLDDVRAVWPADGRCPVLGVVLRPGKQVVNDNSPTLDRVNPAWGYVPSNVAVISYAANRAKGSMTAAQLERIAAWMRAKGLA